MTNTSDKLLLWYARPADEWVEALPIGNGRLGAMVFGGVESERLELACRDRAHGHAARSVRRPDDGGCDCSPHVVLDEDCRATDTPRPRHLTRACGMLTPWRG
jgi:hypothetical protein